MVDKGVATLSGEVNSENAKTESEMIAKSVKGVKSVVNNISVSVPTTPTAPIEVTADDPLNISVTDAIKDPPGLQATVDNGESTLPGEIDKASLPTLLMNLNALNPKKINNNLTVK